MVAWGETMVKGVAEADVAGLNGGDLLASLPMGSDIAQERLLETQERIQMNLGLSMPPLFSSRFKNFNS